MQKKQVIHVIAAGVCALAAADTAFAQTQAFTNAIVDVYAGPAPDYPVVAQVPQGVPVTVMGCVEGYSWCDVAAPELRGWAYGGSLSYPYQGAQVPIMSYGVQIGLPIVAFSIGDYWGRYYRGRPWYHDEPHWANHAPARAEPPLRGAPPMAAHPPGPPPAHYAGDAPDYGRGAEAPPRGGPPQRQTAYAHAPEAPRGGPAQPRPGYAHAPEPPHGGPAAGHEGGPAPSQRAAAEAHGEEHTHPDNH